MLNKTADLDAIPKGNPPNMKREKYIQTQGDCRKKKALF